MKLLSLEPESSASANSATAAYKSDEAFVKTPSPFGMVRETGLEPVRDYHTPLKRARLPIPPSSLIHAAFVPRMIFYHTAAVKVNTVFRFLRTSLTPPGGRNYNRNRTGGKGGVHG